MMICRAFILKGLPTKVVGLPYLDAITKGEDDWADVRRAKVVGVRGWYEPEFGEDAIPPERRFPLDMMVRRMIEDQVAFVLQAAVPPQDCKWWSQTVRDLVQERTAIYEVKV
jgi:hypothetical protein